MTKKAVKLWDIEEERKFFKDNLKNVSPETLFYIDPEHENRYFAYWPRNYRGPRGTLQSRNSLIGAYTETWVKNLLDPIAKANGYYVMNQVVCGEIGLNRMSPADVAIVNSKKNVYSPEDILLLVEVKMSIVWNWEYIPSENAPVLRPIGDFTTHRGRPGLLRSDSMLKAIGKSINIRVSSFEASHIPIIIIGNTPITRSYYNKVDHLKKAGIIQGFYSVNPHPLDKGSSHKLNIKNTPGNGFIRIDNYSELEKIITPLLSNTHEFFSAMLPKTTLGKIIEIANKEESYVEKAKKFLELIRGDDDDQKEKNEDE